MTKRLDGASYFLSPCPGRRIIGVAGVKSRKATMNTRRIGRCLTPELAASESNKSEREALAIHRSLVSFSVR